MGNVFSSVNQFEGSFSWTTGRAEKTDELDFEHSSRNLYGALWLVTANATTIVKIVYIIIHLYIVT